MLRVNLIQKSIKSVCIHVYMYACVFINFEHMCMCLYVGAYVYVVHVCVQIMCVYEYGRVYVYTCVYTCVYLCICVCVYMHIHVCACVCVYLEINNKFSMSN